MILVQPKVEEEIKANYIPKSVIEEDIEKIRKRVKGEVTLSKYDQLTIGECLLVKKLLCELLEKGSK